MLWASLACFAVAAAGGATLAMMYYGQQRRPLALAIGHGAAAGVGLSLFLVGFLKSGGSGMTPIVLVFLLAAASAGLYLFASHLRNRPWHPIGVVLHVLLAFLALTLLFAHLATEESRTQNPEPRRTSPTPSLPLGEGEGGETHSGFEVLDSGFLG